MTNGHWTHRLSEHIDEGLSAAERVACEAHLAECTECAATLEELRAVVAQASLLPELPPERDLWPGIESALAPRRPAGIGGSGAAAGAANDLARRRRRVAMTIPQLVAAAIALVLFSAGGAWVLAPGGGDVSPLALGEGSGEAAPAAAIGPGGGVAQVAFAGAYDDAISQLEVEFERRRAELDPETILVVEENLAIIDGAIADAGLALAEDPSSGFLNTHLANAMRQKVDLLRWAAAIERTES